ncbi:MAG: hypothetical protein K2X27_12010 [Candidatus Obscuribacterales bacterium]|nr:hypothetical protein [Candidatus Obscuribacterales bacterium]
MGWNEGNRDLQSMSREAHHVAEFLDRGDTQRAEQMLRNDLYRLADDPRAQHSFLNMVQQMERENCGADLQIQRGPNGQEFWNITPPVYDSRRPYPQDLPCPQPMPYPEARPYPSETMPYPGRNPYPSEPLPYPARYPSRPSAGEQILEGVALGVGVAVGAELINRALGGNRHEHRNYYDRHRR